MKISMRLNHNSSRCSVCWRLSGELGTQPWRKQSIRADTLYCEVYKRRHNIEPSTRVRNIVMRFRQGFFSAIMPRLGGAYCFRRVRSQRKSSVRNGSQLTGAPWDLRLAGHTSATHTFLVLSLVQVDVMVKSWLKISHPTFTDESRVEMQRRKPNVTD